MSTFGQMFPTNRLQRDARDEDTTGQGRSWLPDGPLDLESGVVRGLRPVVAEDDDEQRRGDGSREH